MKKCIKLTLAMLFMSNIAFAQSTIKISGKVAFPGNNKLVRVIESNGFEKNTLGEVAINPDNTYSLSITKQKPGIVIIDCCQEQNVRAWVEDEDLKIDFRGIDTAKVKIKNPPYVYIQAGPKNELMNLSNFCNHQNYQNMIAISQVMEKSGIEDKKMKSQISMDLYNANNNLTREYTMYLLEHYGYLTSAASLLSYLNPQSDANFIDSILTCMEKANPSSSIPGDYRKIITEKAEKIRSMEVGQQAPSFEYPNEKGKMVSLNTFKGKVLIIDFWASWCGPCRKELPNVKKIYEEFKDNKNVAFLSVSIDAKKEAWEKALKEENMSWTQLLAPNSGRDAMDKYQFNGIPFIICIDQNGKIFRKHLRGDAIRAAIVDALAVEKK